MAALKLLGTSGQTITLKRKTNNAMKLKATPEMLKRAGIEKLPEKTKPVKGRPGKRMKITNDELLELARRGLTSAAIAERKKMHFTTVAARLRQLGGFAFVTHAEAARLKIEVRRGKGNRGKCRRRGNS